MADIDFPASLPPGRDGQFAESSLETKIRDQGDVGAPRQRSRFTRTLERFSFQLLLDDEQKALLLEFYDTTLARGVKQFNWIHPRTLVVYESAMPSRPSPKHLTGQLWTVDIEIEEV